MNTPKSILRALRAITIAALAALLTLAAPAHAGRSCEQKPADPRAVSRGLTLAAQTLDALNASGARVVLLARAGQDLSRYGLRYSHLGFAYRTEDGFWRVVHKLNACGSAEAALYRQGLGEFFLDDPFRYEAAWAVPTPEVQSRLSALLDDRGRVTALHIRPYSIVSYVWGGKYQQSNQWVLETLTMAMDADIRSRSQAQSWLRAHGFRPTTLTLGPLTRLGARISAANVAFDDHPNDKRFSDRIETVSVESVFAWTQSTRLAGAPQTLRL
ncbi:MAG: DUF2145 domain-containing protein [Burkholderiales bacterium]|nr:DUF2145 domain-containing protein [Burkholderiales bacterium]